MTTLTGSQSLSRAVRGLCFAACVASVAACVTVPAPIYAPGPSTAATVPLASTPAAPQARPPAAHYGAPEIVHSGRRLQCVPYARERSGIQIYGDAYTWWDQAEGRFARVNRPEVGAVMAMMGYRTTTRGHVAYVTAVLDARMILVDHANWLNNEEISVNVPVIDVSPGNDWSQVRIWHIPGSHWGGRIYSVQGFILAEPVRIASS